MGYPEQMTELTVVCWSSTKYSAWAEGLRSDAEQFGYAFHRYQTPDDYHSSVQASLNHPRFALRAVQEFDRVLFCDAESRLLKPIPDWPVPSIAVRSPRVPFYLRYNSGTMLIDHSCAEWLQAWIRVVERFELTSLDQQRYYIRHPGDICDELALHSALAVENIHPNELRLECVDRSATAEIARGYWRNSHTVIQHPTIQHWPLDDDPVLAKKLYLQNFPADLGIAPRIFNSGNGRIESHGWVFDGPNRIYAPALFSDRPQHWISEDITLTAEEL